METIAPLWLWATFVAIVLGSLFVDFVVLKKQGAHDIGVKEALNWSLIWIALSFLFNGLFWWAVKDTTGSVEIANTKSLEFLTGYLIEKSLAVDNIFVFLMIFTYFAVPTHFQKRVLMIGIIGAIVLRTVMILVGGWLLAEFHWVLYVFGAFLILTGIKMWWAAGKEPDLDDNPALKLLRKILPVSQNYDGEKFWTVENGQKIATPLFICGRLHPRHLRHHQRPVHCVDQQRVCHSGFACHVLLVGCCGQQVPPAELRFGRDFGVHRHQDVPDRHLQDPRGHLAGCSGRHSGSHHVAQRSICQVLKRSVSPKAPVSFAPGGFFMSIG
jgi:hypothetical protein